MTDLRHPIRDKGTKKKGPPKPKSPRKHDITPSLIEAVCARLQANKGVRRTLPLNGRLHVDRQLPFLCVYRRPTDEEDAGTSTLVAGEAAYLIAPGAPRFQASVSDLVRSLVGTLSPHFGAFVIVEIWAAPDGGKADDAAVPTVLSTFEVHAPAATTITATVEALERRLRRIKVLKQRVKVDVERDDRGYPPGMRRLLTEDEAAELNCSILGIAVPPVYRSPDSTEQFPLLVRALRRSLGLALRQTYFEFTRSCSTQTPAHYHALGRRAVVKAVWEVDRQLAKVSNEFDYLLQLTPVNVRSAWKAFKRKGFEQAPEFHYPPLPVDPALLKRQLYKIPIERVEDPALQSLFREKREEIELKLTMLRDRDTPRFLYESLQLFGGAEGTLLAAAKRLLEHLSPRAKGAGGRTGVLDAAAFCERVKAECGFYRRSCAGFKAGVKMTHEVSGLIVSRGKLLVGADIDTPLSRVDALLAHEVGTHLVTYYNGRLQPFQQLYSGLAGYEELQEGMAVLSEYLVGGLSSGRMRQLAGRVVAVQHLTQGASFLDTFRSLHRDHGFPQRTAYMITMRVYRAGGLTKDVVYLRGLQAILRYVQRGGSLRPLLVGKIAVRHIPLIEELQYRGVLEQAPIVPRYLQEPVPLGRLEALRGGKQALVDLVSKPAAKKRVKN